MGKMEELCSAVFQTRHPGVLGRERPTYRLTINSLHRFSIAIQPSVDIRRVLPIKPGQIKEQPFITDLYIHNKYL